METITRPPSTSERTDTNRRVRTDLRFGGVLLALVIGGNMLVHASDAGILTVLGR